MSKVILAIFLTISSPFGELGSESSPEKTCNPSYRELEEEIKIRLGNFELSFVALAIGCNEELEKAWPPDHDLIEREFAIELRDTYPVQAAVMIRDQPPELRERLVRRLNGILKKSVVTDVYFYNIKLAEFGL